MNHLCKEMEARTSRAPRMVRSPVWLEHKVLEGAERQKI